MEPKFHNNLKTAKRDKDSWEFASPVNTRYPLIYGTAGWAASPVDTRPLTAG